MSERSARKTSASQPDKPDLPSIIARFSPYLQIAHQIPGRIRFKIALAVLDDPQIRELGSDSLNEALGSIPGVREIRVNKLARSCTVEYDHQHIPDAAWADLLAGRASPAAGVLLGIIEDKYLEVRHGQL